MTRPRFALLVALLVVAASLPSAAQDAAAPPAVVALTPPQMDTFLHQAKIVRTRTAGNGVTNSKRVTLSDGVVTHDAHVQTIDESRLVFEAGKASELNFKDSYRYNIAGYRVAMLLGIQVPMSIDRTIDGQHAAVTWWVDNVQMDEESRTKKKVKAPDALRFKRQIQVMRMFDELIQNRDRNQGNLLWTKDWDMWLIDHTRAFRLGTTLLNPKQLELCERAMYAKLPGGKCS